MAVRWLLSLPALCLGLVLLSVGCDEGGNGNNTGAITNAITGGGETIGGGGLILVANPGTTLATVGDTTTIVAQGGVSPYSWTVDNASIGNLTSGGALNDTVVYQSTLVGANTVTATDANGLTGSIIITQDPEPTATAAPPPTPTPSPGG